MHNQLFYIPKPQTNTISHFPVLLPSFITQSRFWSVIRIGLDTEAVYNNAKYAILSFAGSVIVFVLVVPVSSINWWRNHRRLIKLSVPSVNAADGTTTKSDGGVCITQAYIYVHTNTQTQPHCQQMIR